MRETYGNNVLDFFYDASGHPYALKYNGTTYYYITNLQGDVMYLIDANENTVASYEYAPYGNIISATGTMAEINPLRYRGYYYDAELDMYYLQSRYYDPQIGRFINADAVFDASFALGINLFSYCLNNPISRTDSAGYLSTDDVQEYVQVYLTKINSNKIKVSLHFTDKGIRAIKLGVDIAAVTTIFVLEAVGAVLSFYSAGVSLLVTTLVSAKIGLGWGLLSAYVDYCNYGKGAVFDFYIHHGTTKIYYLERRSSFFGVYFVMKSKRIPYIYTSGGKLTWNK